MSAPRPKRLRVLNLSWRVRFCNKSTPDAQEACGWCVPADQTIYICEDQQPDSMADTFLHEVLHSIIFALGVDPKEEENIVHRLATGLCMVWKQNPSAFRWWQSLL